MKQLFSNSIKAIGGSYSQVFFSDNRWLAACLMLASFTDPWAGFSGLLAVVFALVAARVLGLFSAYVHNGWYTYNVLLTGLALGANYEPGASYFVMLFFTSVISFLVSIWLASFMRRFNLPFLSIPFVLSVWLVLLNVQGFQEGILVTRPWHDHTNLVDEWMKLLSHKLSRLGIGHTLFLYFKTMASIFFQKRIVAGIIISIGLLISSRIAFFLSWLGFIGGYVYFRLTAGAGCGNEYLMAGFNYVFVAIALSGFYLIPSLHSFLLVLLAVPLTAVFQKALSVIVLPIHLPLYSLPFSMAVIILLSVLQNRVSAKNLNLVQYQLYSPEKNLYAFYTYLERFKRDTLVHIYLPFFGEWTVSQGHNGKHTHKEEWKYALDFVVTDSERKTYRMPGRSPEDFYCYSLPVLAPADGYVVTVKDGTDDNMIGDVNLKENWGNTVIIKHSEKLFTKLSHLKRESIKVKEGDYVKRGDILALCGNSGRSPEPHIHFQIQSSAVIGAATLSYPISYFISKGQEGFKFHSFEVPQEGEVILRPQPTPLLKEAFHFIPGKKMRFVTKQQNKIIDESWEVITDAYNSTYIYCKRTGSRAYLSYNENIFYFTGYAGNKNCLLYYFYLAAYKIVLSYFSGLEIKDRLPVETYRHPWLKPVQDLLAPFYIFMRPVYRCRFRSNNGEEGDKIILDSAMLNRNGNSDIAEITFSIEVFKNRINKLIINKGNECITAENTGSE